MRSELDVKIDDAYHTGEINTFLKEFTNATSFSARGLGVDYSSAPKSLLIGLAVAVLVAIAAIVYEFYDTRTLKRTVRRGEVLCGVNAGLPGFSIPDDKGNWSGFDVDICRATLDGIVALEDDEIGERMDAGRMALYSQGRSEVGPYQSPMEDGMQHFHEFYRAQMEAHIGHL